MLDPKPIQAQAREWITQAEETKFEAEQSRESKRIAETRQEAGIDTARTQIENQQETIARGTRVRVKLRWMRDFVMAETR